MLWPLGRLLRVAGVYSSSPRSGRLSRWCLSSQADPFAATTTPMAASPGTRASRTSAMVATRASAPAREATETTSSTRSTVREKALCVRSAPRRAASPNSRPATVRTETQYTSTKATLSPVAGSQSAIRGGDHDRVDDLTGP